MAMNIEGPMDGLDGGLPMIPTETFAQGAEKMIPREVPEPDEARKNLVEAWTQRVKRAKKHWDKDFKRMRDDQDFAYGLQWSKDEKDPRYKANLTLRLIQQRTAFLYAKNPKFVARRRERLLATVWDGSQETLSQMQQAGAMMLQQTQQGLIPPQQLEAQALPMMEVAQDAMRVKEIERQLDRISKTLELLFDYNVKEQAHPFKSMMKMTVRRAVTCGVAYVKLGFQRVMEKKPDIEARISDASQRLATLERLAADIADGEVDADTSKEVEELRLLLKELTQQVEFVAREGLVFDYPLSTSIIPDPKVVHLREFLGADWVAQEYVLSPNEVKEIYSVDVGKEYRAYNRSATDGHVVERAGMLLLENREQRDNKDEGDDAPSCCVWEIYSRKDGIVYHVCDGYPEFLREPTSPDCMTDRFWPWFALTLNDADHETRVYPPSDVSLIRDQQEEFNRSRQALREHRKAARPKTVVAGGMIDEEDLEKLSSHPDNAIIELNGLQPGQKVDDLLQPFRGPPIDPNLYETNSVYEDILRTTGVQEANLGGTNRSTATQSQIAEASRATAMGSNIDDLDDLLTQLARTGGQILLQEVTPDTVKKVVGEGAVWPELSRQQIADEVWLEVEAGSTGRPNQAAEIANMERLAPILMQIPGISPEFLAKEMLRRLDDRLDLSQAFQSMLPSIVAMNSIKSGPGGQMPGRPPGEDPNAQGQQGQNNAPRLGTDNPMRQTPDMAAANM